MESSYIFAYIVFWAILLLIFLPWGLHRVATITGRTPRVMTIFVIPGLSLGITLWLSTTPLPPSVIFAPLVISFFASMWLRLAAEVENLESRLRGLEKEIEQ